MEPSASAPARILGLLRGAHAAGRSGHLHLTAGAARRGLTLRDGQIRNGRSDAAGEHLGDVLVRHGFLAQADLDRAVAAVLAERRSLGTVLAELGLIAPARLQEAVGLHVREILFAALDEPGVSAAFEDLQGLPDDAAGEEPASGLSTAQVLLEAARRLADPAAVRDALGDLDHRLVPAADARLRAQAVALTPAEGFVLSRIDGTLSAREVIGLIPLPAEETERSLLALLCTGAIDQAPPRPVSHRAPAPPRAPVPPAPGPAPGPAPAPPPPVTAPLPPPAEPAAVSPPPSRTPEDVRRLVLELHADLATRDHFEVLGITPQAGPAELRAAYARLARTLHPDACRDAALGDIDAQREVVFIRVCQAYETLRDPEARASYERDFRRRKPRPTPSSAPTVIRMPLVPGTTPAAPEKPPPVPAPPPGPVAPGPSLDERLDQTIAAGEGLLQEGHYWEAIQQLEPTLQQARGELRVRARLALARACVKNPKWLKRAENHLLELLQEDPERIEAHLLLGDLYRVGNLRGRAVAAYRKALSLQPHNRQALRELARLEAEESPTPPKGGSLLGFLKKR